MQQISANPGANLLCRKSETYLRFSPLFTMDLRHGGRICAPPLPLRRHQTWLLTYTAGATTERWKLKRTLYVCIPDSARPMPGRKFRKKMVTRNQWPIRKFLRCRSNELSKLWNTNEKKLVEMLMKWHEIIHARLTSWTNEPTNQ